MKDRKEATKKYYQRHKEKIRESSHDYYQKKKEHKLAQRKERYLKKKEQSQLLAQKQLAKYYDAEAIKILMSLKEYIELSQQKYKLGADFCGTLKANSEEISSIVCVMKLRESAERLQNSVL